MREFLLMFLTFISFSRITHHALRYQIRQKYEQFSATRFPKFGLRYLKSIIMKLIVSTHDVTLTEAIQNHIENRIDRLNHLDRFAVSARVTLEHDHTRAPDKQFKCSVQMSMPGPDLFAEDVEAD